MKPCVTCGSTIDVGVWDGRSHGFSDCADVPICATCQAAASMIATRTLMGWRAGLLTPETRSEAEAAGMRGLAILTRFARAREAQRLTAEGKAYAYSPEGGVEALP